MGLNDGLLTSVHFFSWKASFVSSSTLWMFSALLAHEAQVDPEPELVRAFPLV